ncbi:hypothetical protein [Methylobacterium komagatae]|uniref:hypothetical protein n=1 Tax=Methylobacterium komagatae TaxID=374425 RepID=UPI00366B430A
MSLIDLTGYRLTFDDEFNTRSISQTGQGTTWADIRSQWRFDENSDIGFGRSSFVDAASGYDPFNVQGGALTITAVPDKTKYGYPGSWESGLITTQGNFSQTYGYFEMRADLTDTKGGWDAFWMLPNNPAPNPNKLPGWQEPTSSSIMACTIRVRIGGSTPRIPSRTRTGTPIFRSSATTRARSRVTTPMAWIGRRIRSASTSTVSSWGPSRPQRTCTGPCT